MKKVLSIILLCFLFSTGVQARLLYEGKEFKKAGKPLDGNGIFLPIYKCSNKKCDGIIWDKPSEKEPVVEEEV